MKLASYSSTISVMHGPIYRRFMIWFVLLVMGGKVLICSYLFRSVLLLAECDHIVIWKWLCFCDRNVLSNKIACEALEEDCHWNIQFFAWVVWRWKQTYLKVVSQNDLRRCPETWKACMERCVASSGNCCKENNLVTMIWVIKYSSVF